MHTGQEPEEHTENHEQGVVEQTAVMDPVILSAFATRETEYPGNFHPHASKKSIPEEDTTSPVTSHNITRVQLTNVGQCAHLFHRVMRLHCSFGTHVFQVGRQESSFLDPLGDLLHVRKPLHLAAR